MRKYLILTVAMLMLPACATTNNDVKTNSLSYTGVVDKGSNPVIMNTNLPVKKLSISSGNSSNEFQVEIAATDAQRKVGLMNRKSLDENKGMLFIFQSSGLINFWMKNTLITLDMVFIDSNGYIKHIARNASPCTSSNDQDCPLYSSKVSAQYVLELKGGITDKLGVRVGDRVTWL